ncbi:MmpS family transport accessory protein [Nonomuraea ceibae]|uniref:MmpS family transport accessory protein n=1 Tax=Nonomuraea ceibae TaxID=1935170 RepID=UPI001C5EC3BB|nr:MmpS family transport accessory protein [Nonomuraea ceibae]
MSYPQQPYSQPNPAYGQPPAPRTNGLAVASLVLGLIGFISCGLTSILAVIFGHVAIGQIRRDGTDGRGMALAGVILGWVLSGAWILFWVLSWLGVVSSALYSAAITSGPAEPARTRLDLGRQPGGEQSSGAAAGGQAVVFEVSGADGATSIGTLTYSLGFDIKQESGVTLPYSKEVSAGEPVPLSLIAQNAGQQGTITCRIKVDGKVVREDKSEGPYGVCNVRADAP